MEHNFLMFIGVLLICLVISMMMFKKPKKIGGQHGFKCVGMGMQGNMKKKCVLVNEAPNKENGVYSNYAACVDNCENIHPPGYLKSYKCMIQADGSHICVPTTEDPNPMNGFFSTQEECVRACAGPVPGFNATYECTPMGCVQSGKPVDNVNVFDNAVNCAVACSGKGFIQNYKCVDGQCEKSIEMVNNVDVFNSAEECVYKCAKIHA
jgi:hypothetical protein